MPDVVDHRHMSWSGGQIDRVCRLLDKEGMITVNTPIPVRPAFDITARAHAGNRVLISYISKYRWGIRCFPSGLHIYWGQHILGSTKLSIAGFAPSTCRGTISEAHALGVVSGEAHPGSDRGHRESPGFGLAQCRLISMLI